MKKVLYVLFPFLMILYMGSCNTKNYNILSSTSEILVTSESGDKIAKKENVSFKEGTPEGITIQIMPHKIKQKMDGIGSSFTESSAFVLAHLKKDKRRQVMVRAYVIDQPEHHGRYFQYKRCEFFIDQNTYRCL